MVDATHDEALWVHKGPILWGKIAGSEAPSPIPSWPGAPNEEPVPTPATVTDPGPAAPSIDVIVSVGPRSNMVARVASRLSRRMWRGRIGLPPGPFLSPGQRTDTPPPLPRPEIVVVPPYADR